MPLASGAECFRATRIPRLLGVEDAVRHRVSGGFPLVEAANRRGTSDNLTAAVVRMVGPTSRPPG